MAQRRHLQTVTDDSERVDELDSSYPDRFLECRSIGHQWQLVGYYHAYGEIVRSLHCPRCNTDRHDRWTRGGARLGNNYTYTDGYGISGGGVTKHEVRQETLRRVHVFDSADDMHRALMSGKSKKAPAKKRATG